MNRLSANTYTTYSRVADIILDDLIDQVGDELDSFCAQVANTLIDSELNVS